MDVLDTTRVSLITIAAGLVLVGTSVTGPALAADDMQMWARNDAPTVLSDDEDDDDLEPDSDDPTGEADDQDSNDATNSVQTAVSRDEDLSKAGLTRDMTEDGPGGLRRDWSDNATDDASIGDTRASAPTQDGTASNFTAVSNDRDKSRADLTKDMTRDGGDLTRDLTQNKTNDKTRNDTR